MNKNFLIYGLTLLFLVSIAFASTSTFQNVNITANNSAFEVNNATGGRLFLVNASAGTNQVEVWNPLEASNDYLKLYHDASNGYIKTASGNLMLSTSSINLQVANSGLIGGVTLDLGTSAEEWRALYLTNGTSTGIYFGLGQESQLRLSNSQLTASTLLWGMPDTSDNGNSLIITDTTHVIDDYDHPAQSAPTIFVQGSEDPDNVNTKWLSLAHDNTSAVIDSGSDQIVLDDSTTVSGNTTLGDEVVGNTAFSINDDGTYIRMDAQGDKNVKIISPQTEFWDDVEATNDYVSIAHDGSAGYLNTGSGTMNLGSAGNYLGWDTGYFYSAGTANTDYLGLTTNEWKGLYLGNSTGSGIYFGMRQESILRLSNAQVTSPTIMWNLPDGNAYGNSLIFGANTFAGDDYDHPAQTNPTIFVQSLNDPDADNTRWGSIAHDNTSFVIDSGSDQITLDDTTYVSGNISISDNVVGNIVLDIYNDGTTTKIVLANGAMISDNSTCLILSSPNGLTNSTICNP